MRSSTSFSRRNELIVVEAIAIGPTGRVKTQLVFDTGAVLTTLNPALAEAIGYTRAAMIKPTVMRTAAAEERGYLICLGKLTTLGIVVSNLEVNVADLGYDVDGLLGINFLWHFNFEVRPTEQRILLERIAP